MVKVRAHGDKRHHAMAQAQVIPFPGTQPSQPSPVVTGKMVCRRYPLAAGDQGVARTVHWMRGLAAGNEGAANAVVRTVAVGITKDVASRDTAGEIKAVFDWVKTNIKFRGEFKEFIQSPLITLELRAGDCDDHATLIAALLATLGIRSKFKTVAVGDRQFSHVYTVAIDPKSGAEVALDTTVGKARPGWEVPNPERAKNWKPMGDVTSPSGAQTALQIVNDLQPIIQATATRIAYGANAGLYPFQQSFYAPSQIYGTRAGGVATIATPSIGTGAAVIAGLAALGLVLVLARR